jgi:hypothetical protein
MQGLVMSGALLYVFGKGAKFSPFKMLLPPLLLLFTMHRFSAGAGDVWRAAACVWKRSQVQSVQLAAAAAAAIYDALPECRGW